MSGEDKRDPIGRWLPGADSPTHFKKGKSGNPGGKLKRVQECLDIALFETPASFKLLVAQRDNPDEDSRVRQGAAKILIAYGIGEPPKVIAIDAENDAREAVEQLSVEDRRNLARLTLAEEQPEDDGDDDEVDPSAH